MDEKQNSYQDVSTYNNYLRVRHGQGPAGADCQELQDGAVDRLGGRRCRQAAQVHHGRDSEACAAGGAHLPASLRGGLVDRGAVGRLLAERAAQAGGADGQSQVSSRSRASSTGADAAARARRHRSSPTWKACGWTKPCTRWRMLCVGMYGETLPTQDGAPVRLIVPWKYGFKSIKSIVKIRLVGRHAAHHLEPYRPARVRLLLQRESGRGPSALEPGHGTPAGRIPQRPTLMFNGYGDQVASLYNGHGSEEELLSICCAAAGRRSWSSLLAWRRSAGCAGGAWQREPHRQSHRVHHALHGRLDDPLYRVSRWP